MEQKFNIPDFHNPPWCKVRDVFEDTEIHQGGRVVEVWRWGATHVYRQVVDGVLVEGWETYWLPGRDTSPFLKSWRPHGPQSLMRAVRLFNDWKIITGTRPHWYRVRRGPPRSIDLLFSTGGGKTYRKILVEDTALPLVLHS